MFRRLLVTGGAGFMGSAFVRYALGRCERVVTLDLLTYAGNLGNLKEVMSDARHLFVQGDICNEVVVERLCREHQIEAIVHFAAESHVDRSITDPRAFLKTNVEGTVCLLEVMRKLPHLHLHHISTDEVYGSIVEGAFNENSHYHPNSPYAASKAAADHFVRAYAHTYNLSVTLSHSSNNYGPYQHVEKLIPCMIQNCFNQKPLPIYGNGENVRDWVYVEDHAEAIGMILEKGKRGHTYDIGGGAQIRNIDLIHELIDLLGEQYRTLIAFVPDRAGHDLRYAIDCSKIEKEIGWRPRHHFSEGLKKTVAWYTARL